jgi:multidrug transporter EmrE-like cation transporter
MKTPLSSILLVVAGSFIGSFGAVFLKQGSAKVRSGLMQIFNVRLALGVGLYLLSTVFFLAAIQNGELSVLYPLVSFGSIWTLLWAKLFFHEPLTRSKFVGVFLILVGAFVMRMGG